MDITEYYKKTESIIQRIEGGYTALSTALNYDSDNDHPSSWVPNVQFALIEFFRVNSNHELSGEVLELYIQGAIMETKANNKEKFTCFVLGVLSGVLIFGWILL